MERDGGRATRALRGVRTEEVVVVGAGLAGLSCAFELATAGRRVLLLEARPVLGGRASSWIDGGMPVESGLHRYIGFYRALPDLLERAGGTLDDAVIWEDEIEIRLPDGGPSAVLGVSPSRRPFETLLSALGENDFLPPSDKASLGSFFLAGLAEYRENPSALDSRTVVEYARACGVTEPAIERVLTPLTAGLFFMPPDRYSAYPFFGLVAPAVARAGELGVGALRGGMSEVLAAPVASAIQRRGGQVWVRATVDRLVVDGDRVLGVETLGQIIRASRVVLATSLGSAQDLLRGPFGNHPWFEPVLRLPSMPAVTIQIETDGPSLSEDRTTFGPGTVIASFAEQSRSTFRQASGRLSVILSPPERFLEMDDESVLRHVIADAARLGIALEGRVRSSRVARIERDFYSLAPGHDALRPAQQTPIRGLTLAGDYTRQPFFATMEGAVISGRLAAKTILSPPGGRSVRPRSPLQVDLAPRFIPAGTTHHLKNAVSETQAALRSLLFAALDAVTERNQRCGGRR